MTHAAPIVRADYDQLREIRDRFARDAATIREMRRALSREQDTLAGGDWVGEGARAFYDEMDHLVLPRIDRLGDALAQAGAARESVLLYRRRSCCGRDRAVFLVLHAGNDRRV